MIHIAYLKRALRIAAQEALSEFDDEDETRIRQRVNEWIKQARHEIAAKRPANQVPGAKPAARKFSLTDADANETYDKMVDDVGYAEVPGEV